MVIKGYLGNTATYFAPVLGELADLAVVYLRTESTMIEADQDNEASAIAPYGDYIEVNDHSEVVPRALEYAEKHRIDGVMTVSEPLLGASARVAESLGLPHDSVATVDRMNDKHLQRLALAEHDVPGPAFLRIASRDELSDALDAVKLPAVLKPATGAGSVFTFRIDKPDDLFEAYDTARERFADSELLKWSAPMFELEELLVGEGWYDDARFANYCSAECLVYDGDVIHIAITDRTPLRPPFLETGHPMPSTLSEDAQREVYAVADAALMAVGATNCGSQVELMLTRDGPKVIEVNGRLGGHVPYVWSSISDAQPLRDVGRIALGQRPADTVEADRWGAMWVHHPPLHEEIITGIRGIEDFRKVDGVVSVVPAMHVGQHVEPLLGITGGCILAFVIADSVDGLFELRRRLESTVRFDVEPIDDTYHNRHVAKVLGHDRH